MQKIIVVLATLSLFILSTAQAATTGSITLSGSISASTAITVTGLTGYNALNLTTSATDLAVADIHEINNTTAGYMVTMSSANAGLLKNGTLGSVGYTAKYNNVAVTLSSTPVNVTTGAPSNAVVSSVKTLKISYSGAAANSLMVGNYSDTLTFTIAAN